MIAVLTGILLHAPAIAQPAPAPSPRDSAWLAARRDSLSAQREYHQSLYRRFPVRADSLYCGITLRADQLLSADADNLSEALSSAPQVVAVPFSLASQRNRALIYGYPFDLGGWRGDLRAWGTRLSDLTGTDVVSMAEVREAGVVMPGGVRYRPYPISVVAPEMSLFWENGVFNEDILAVRFVRPLAQSLDIGVFSDYRHLAGKTYSHDNGNIFDFYRTFISDTLLIAHEGRNPLTHEQTVGGRLQWHGTRAGAEVKYTYVDADNDAVRQNDSLRRVLGYGTLEWERVSCFRNDLGVAAYGVLTPRISMRGGLFATHGSHRIVPFSRARPRAEGGEDAWGVSLTPAIGAAGDTLWAGYELWNSVRSLYVKQHFESRDQRVRLGLTHGYGLGSLHGSLRADGGHAFLDQAGASGNAWLWNAEADATLGRLRCRLFASSAAVPYVMPYDLSEQMPASLWDGYPVLGVETHLSGPRAGLMASYCYVGDVDSSTITAAWPHGAIPYAAPHSVVTIAPLTGRWHGFALRGRCMVSDAMPYVKAQAALSYQAAFARKRAYLCLDAVLDYWSSRDTIRFGDPGQWGFWGREVYDASLRAAVQISTFRLYYKVDNILNRRQAYVPGYYMPGLTFRWGFGWVIPE